MKQLLWLDDYRKPKLDWLQKFSPIGIDVNVNWVKNYYGFTDWITKNGLPDAICFDHDIGLNKDEDGNIIEKSGHDCAKWLIEYCLDNDLKLPKFSCQSDNIVGRDNILGILNSFKKHQDNHM